MSETEILNTLLQNAEGLERLAAQVERGGQITLASGIERAADDLRRAVDVATEKNDRWRSRRF